MKNSLLITVAAMSITSAFAQNQNQWSFSLSSTVASRYVGESAGALFSKQPVFQTSLFGFHRSGFYCGVWQSIPLNHHYQETLATETDFGAGYNWTINSGWNGDVSLFKYDLKHLPSLWAANLTVSATRGKFKPYIVLEHDFTESDELPSGTIYKLGVTSSHCGVDWSAAVLGNFSPDGHPYGSRQNLLSGVWLKLSKGYKIGGGTLTPALVLQRDLGYAPTNGGVMSNQTVWKLNYTLKF